MSVEHARAVADAVLYEGYLLYPYRASSSKNQSRWQFGVLSPPGALQAGHGEDPAMASQFLIRRHDPATVPMVTVQLRFLQLQRRSAQQVQVGGQGTGEFVEVADLVVGSQRWLSWDEAVECEVSVGPWPVEALSRHAEQISVPGGEDVETLLDDLGAVGARLVRRRTPLHAELRVNVEGAGTDLMRVSVTVENTASGAAGDKHSAIAASFIGAHLLLEVRDGDFVSMTDPPADAVDAVAACEQHRCWPVLAAPDGDDSVLLVSPIILPEHPELAPQSAGALFDSTEIDEILTLRVMTLTEQEKAMARATDPRAAEIIDRCDAMSPQDLAQLHGILRDPALDLAALDLGGPDLSSTVGFDDAVPWWDPAVDTSVSPEHDEVLINGIAVSRGSLVRVHPSRRADAQDLFYADQVARVTAVLSDVDGDTHVAVILVDDPAAELHDAAGRYLYFAPDELEPVPGS